MAVISNKLYRPYASPLPPVVLEVYLDIFSCCLLKVQFGTAIHSKSLDKENFPDCWDFFCRKMVKWKEKQNSREHLSHRWPSQPWRMYSAVMGVSSVSSLCFVSVSHNESVWRRIDASLSGGVFQFYLSSGQRGWFSPRKTVDKGRCIVPMSYVIGGQHYQTFRIVG